MGVFQNNLLAGAAAAASSGAAAFYDYQIEQSARFSYGESTHMYRTPSSTGDRRTFTFSTWIKRANQNDNDAFFGTYTGSSAESAIKFSDGTHDGKLGLYNYTGSFTINVQTNARYRDNNAWYHVVARVDTTQGSGNNRVRYYVNGTQVTDMSTNTQPSQSHTTMFNYSGQTNYVGWYGNSATNRFDGYMAETILADGYSYDASYFGEFKNGVWIPKDYHNTTGDYGTNGFLLKYENASDLGNDSSGNNNDFTVNNMNAYNQVLDSPTFGS
jgi:hypothetical protein